jgi:hypothetical protein
VHPKEELPMIPCADDDKGAAASDWFDCADAFLMGRIGGHLADARGGASADPESRARRERYAAAFLLAPYARSS